MRPKFAGVGNLGAEAVAEVKATVLTREMTRRETHALFSNAAAAQDRDRSVVKKLFVQAPGAETSTRLAKTAAADDLAAGKQKAVDFIKRGLGDAAKRKAGWKVRKFLKNPDQAGQKAGQQARSFLDRASSKTERLGRGLGSVARKVVDRAKPVARDVVRGNFGQAGAKVLRGAADAGRGLARGAERAADFFSKTSAVDAWFLENQHLLVTPAQSRYPELLKAGAAVTGGSTATSPMTTAAAKGGSSRVQAPVKNSLGGAPA